ncbi:long-chain fatty acid--CoA ligase [Umezawaea sp. Da 62-37]|uniref:AMP-dependent synthetase/ligase n=1 Tax=Umezawaea sp. Da 62-37 TaxID=3075927 RepID=UPI0028F74144|nr:long-chain fatty acid--CoA ligase [Umezawaea sp. Da 62-37]WNV87156.1 long-chain fatty acid--CoA ligase [Umezawaea sp. Da 62-37]
MREVATAPLPTVPVLGGLAELVHTNAERIPDSTAFRRKTPAGWVPVTARRFRDEVVEAARGLIALGVRPGDRVVILSSTRYEWTLVDFAVWAARAVSVPVYVTSSAEQVDWIVADSGATAAVVETGEHERLARDAFAKAGRDAPVWRIDDVVEELAKAGAAVPRSAVHDNRGTTENSEAATIIYTSGTTGRPKGCVLTHANFLAEARNAVGVLRPLFGAGGAAGASTLLFLPLAHVVGRMIEIGAVWAGVTLGHTPNVRDALGDLATFRPTFVLAVPYVLEKIYQGAWQKAHGSGRGGVFDAAVEVAVAHSSADSPGPVLGLKHAAFDRLIYRRLREVLGGRCRYVLSGGAALAPKLVHFFHSAGITVLEGYGLTETTSTATINTPDVFRAGTAGRPLPGMSIRISDSGEVLVKGPTLFQGYWHDERATAESFRDGWFATGDLGRLDDGGFLVITGRSKDILVTSGGKNVSPGVMEDRVNAHPLVGNAVVVGDGRRYVAALLTLDHQYFPVWKENRGKPAEATVADLLDDHDLLADLQEAVDLGNAAVSRAESVRRFRVLSAEFTPENGFLTPSLKIKRSVVVEAFADEVEACYPQHVPSS